MDFEEKNNVHQQKLIKIHTVAIIFYMAYAWLMTKLAGCEAYGLSNCAQREASIYFLLLLSSAIPILLSHYLNKTTYVLLFLYSVLICVVFFPVGTVIGIFSISELMKYRKMPNKSLQPTADASAE